MFHMGHLRKPDMSRVPGAVRPRASSLRRAGICYLRIRPFIPLKNSLWADMAKPQCGK